MAKYDYEQDPAEWLEYDNYGERLAALPDMHVDICDCGEVLDDHGCCDYCEG